MRILNVKVDDISSEEALEKIKNFLIDNQQHYIVTPNPEIILLAQKDNNFKNILNNADISVIDGIGLILASKILGCHLKHRITGVDLFEKICLMTETQNLKIFLLGGRSGVAKRVIEKLRALGSKSEIAELEIVDDKSIESINIFGPNIIFVALGAPKQERWISNNLDRLPTIRIAMAVGGAFDFMAGDIKRAPVWTQKLGLEWLWRLVMQPWRIGRIYNAVIKFPLLVIKSRFIKVKTPKVESQ